MDTTIVSMLSEELSQSLKTAHLERAYEQVLRQAERIYEEERARALRVQLLLAEDENDSLQERISDTESQLDRLEDGNDELRQQLLETEADLQRLQTELKMRMRDIERYKAESYALNATTSDTTKILTEKLALAREIANLRPELEHLKSQATTQSKVLAEKLALQREVNALQVELETEKRAVQRITANDKSSAGNTDFAIEFEDLKKELAKERKEAQKVERENRKKIVEWESQKDVLEGKLDAFRSKLRSTKEQLKEAQDELERTQATQFAKSAELAAARAGANPKKRTVAHFDPDMTIGTPGHGKGRPAAKKAKITGAAEKTSFSITPFLNRTLSILPESPSVVDENISKHIDKIAAEAEQASTAAKDKEKPAAKTTAVPTTKSKAVQPLKESTNPKANTIMQKPRLAKVTEEDDEGVVRDDPPDFDSDQPVKRQRVLGQKKMFDDASDTEVVKGKRKLGLGLGLRGGGGFGDLSFMSRGDKTLTAFSPLKKDRKATASVGA